MKNHGINATIKRSKEETGPVYTVPISCMCGLKFTEPTTYQGQWMQREHGLMAGLLVDALIHLDTVTTMEEELNDIPL